MFLELSGPASDRCPVVNNSSVCSRVLPVCQHRPVRYPLGIPTSAIHQTMPAAAIKVSYILRIPPEYMNHNAKFSLEQQTTNYSYRFPIPNNISLLRTTSGRWPCAAVEISATRRLTVWFSDARKGNRMSGGDPWARTLCRRCSSLATSPHHIAVGSGYPRILAEHRLRSKNR